MLQKKLKIIIFFWIVACCVIVGLFGTAVNAQVWENIELIGVGAKSLALGSSGVSYLDDANAPYLNSAGLASLNTIQVTTLYTQLLNDVNYNTFALSIPTNYGVYGINYIIASLPDINLATSLSEGRPVSSGTATYSSSQINLSFAQGYDNFLFFNNIALGGTAKYFIRNFTGLPASYEALGNASGFDLDLGIQYIPYKDLIIGIAQHNFLPASYGGKLIWASGYEESIPTFTKFGFTHYFSNKSVLFSVDSDVYLTKNNYPVPFHVGVQHTPLPFISLRLGYDENITSGGAANSVTKTGNVVGGVGLQFGDFSFDYAYHPYNQEEQSATHFFTVSYTGHQVPMITDPVNNRVTKKSARDIMVKTEPFANVTFYNNEQIMGHRQASAFGIAKQKVNLAVGNNEIIISSRGDTLKGYGKDNLLITRVTNTLAKKAITPPEITINNKTFRVTANHFKDLNQVSSLTIQQLIAALTSMGYFTGYPDGTFKPRNNVTNAEFIAVVARLKKLSMIKKDTVSNFKDLKKGHWVIPYVNAAEKAGIISGHYFRPLNKIRIFEAHDLLGKYFTFEKSVSQILKNHRIREILKREDLVRLIAEINFVKNKLQQIKIK